MVKVVDKHGVPHTYKEARHFSVDKEGALILTKLGASTPAENLIAAYGPGMWESAATVEEQAEPAPTTKAYVG